MYRETDEECNGFQTFIKLKQNELELEKKLLNDELTVAVSKPDQKVSQYRSSQDTEIQEIQNEEPEKIWFHLDFESFLRKSSGLPMLLKAGEYSPNHPLARRERAQLGGAGAGDVFAGLGEQAERQRHITRQRQRDYRTYLDQQIKQKSQKDAKIKTENEKEPNFFIQVPSQVNNLKQLRQNQNRSFHISNDSSLNDSGANVTEKNNSLSRDEHPKSNEDFLSKSDVNVPMSSRLELDAAETNRENINNKESNVFDGQAKSFSKNMSRTIDFGIQCELLKPDEALSASPKTTAERELSPERPIKVQDRPIKSNPWILSAGLKEHDVLDTSATSNRSHHNADASPSADKTEKKSPGYVPSILDAEFIETRNHLAEQESAEKRISYQRELRKQIIEQKRLQEERRAREKLLEEAETRRLEAQLQALHIAQTDERTIVAANANKENYDKKRRKLENEIDDEKKKLFRAKPLGHNQPTVHVDMFEADKAIKDEIKLPFSTNITNNSIFSLDYDIESYLRKNLSPKDDRLLYTPLRLTEYNNSYGSRFAKLYHDRKNHSSIIKDLNKNKNNDSDLNKNKTVEINKNITVDAEINKNIRVDAEINKNKTNGRDLNRNETDDRISKESIPKDGTFTKHELSYLKNPTKSNFIDDLPIPILRASPTCARKLNIGPKDSDGLKSKADMASSTTDFDTTKITKQKPNNPNSTVNLSSIRKFRPDMPSNKESDAMKIVEDKWQVPAMQKNILGAGDGSVNILTQLGAIRQQLQLEQLKLDQMLGVSDA